MTTDLLWYLIATGQTTEDKHANLRLLQTLSLLAANQTPPEMAPLGEGPLHPESPTACLPAQGTGSRHPLVDPAYEGYWCRSHEFAEDFVEPEDKIDPQTGFVDE